jgi:LMBR1-like membrane protein.
MQTSWSTQFLATVSFALGFSSTVLLPIDLFLTRHGYQNSNDDMNQNDDEENFTMLPWHILFWSTFILAWAVLPLVREIILSGEFTVYRRFKDGIRKLLVRHLILLSLVTIFVIWLAIHLKELNVIPVLIALGNTYGLLLVSLLLGYGLVALPRSLWRQARPEYELRKVYLMAVKADDKLFEAVWQLQDIEYKIDCAVARIVDLDENDKNELFYKYCVNELLHGKTKTAALTPDLNMRRTANRNQSDDEGDYSTIFDQAQRPTMKELVTLNKKLKRAQENVFHAEQRWNGVLEKHHFFSQIQLDNVVPLLNDGATSSSMVAGASSGGNHIRITTDPLLVASNNQQTCRSQMTRMWVRYFRPFVYRCLGLICATMSVAILWSEATLGIRYNLSPFALVQEYFGSIDSDRYDILFQIAALVPLLYMSICTSNGLFQVGRFGPYCLRGNRQSHGVALVFNAQYLVRLQFPLAYNYLLMLKYDTSETAFSKFLGQMNVVPIFGKSFPVYAPLLIIFLCSFTLCNIYAKLMNLVGIDHQDALLVGDKETLEAKVNEGKTLLLRQRNYDVSSNNADASRNNNESLHSENGTVEMSERKSLNTSIV